MPARADVEAREAARKQCIREFGFDPRKRRHPAAPRTRADCLNGPRPCPWISCRKHLFLDIGIRGKLGRRSHVVKWHFGRDADPTELPPRASCALDLADDHAKTGMTLGEIGAVWRLHSERVRQIEVSAVRKVRRAFKRMGIDASWLDALALEVPESMFALAMDRAAQVVSELDVELPEEPPPAAAKVLTVPRNGSNGHSRPPMLALSPPLPKPTPLPPSAPTLRNHIIFL